MQIDAAMAYEGTTAPTLENQSRGRAGAPPAAVLVPDSAWYLSNALTTVAASWPYITTRVLRDAVSAPDVSGWWTVDATAIDPDPHTDAVDVEVFAWIVSPATFVGGTAVAAAGFDTQIYTREYGESGVSVPANTSGLYRLGTVPLPRERVGPTTVGVTIDWTSGAGNVDLAWVVLIPARRRALWTSGFSPGAGALVSTSSDGLGRGRLQASGFGWVPNPGAGQVITASPGGNQAVWCIVDLGGSATTLRLIRFTPTPRWHHLRDA
jgi:hypothetical protein